MMIDNNNLSKNFTTDHTNYTKKGKREEGCIAINNILPYNDNMSLSLENRRLIFRLVVVLYLFSMINPGFFTQKRQIRDSENGIGGGNFNNEDISLTLASYEMDPPETAALEPDSLLKTRILLYDSHTVTSGENISTLAINMGLNQGTIISVNKITNTRLLQIGKVLKIPNQDGILHAVRSGDTLSSIA
jgi:hypothetical protein